MHSRKIRKTGKPQSVTPETGPSESAGKNPFPTNAADSERTEIPGTGEPVDLDRHAAKCRICSHAQRLQIEADFVDWKSPVHIARDYGLPDRSSVYRHSRAFRLFERRRRNLLAALESLVERVDEVEVTGGVIVAAVQACAKINARGEWIEREETVNLDELFEHMSSDELKTYAERGTLPSWFQQAIGSAGRRNGEKKASG
jgi:hypothetical protein